jgi:hypothetical protein
MIAQTQIKARRRPTSRTSQKNERATFCPSIDSSQPAAIPGQIPVSLSTVGEAPSPSHERIAARAYELWEVNGKRAGTDRDDWFLAEALLRTGA